MSDAPIFMSEKDGLWRIASLCQQLKSVDRQISEALTLRTEPVASAIPGQRPPRVSRMMLGTDVMPASYPAVEPSLLSGFTVFRSFSQSELELLAQSIQRVERDAGTLLFAEGDSGGSCFVVIEGVVDVSVKVRGQPQLLAQLGPSSIFGQLSLIEGEPRNASCSIHKDAVLGELSRDACERLLGDDSPIALQLLGALNQGLVEALRSADRRLMRLETDRESSQSSSESTTAPRLA